MENNKSSPFPKNVPAMETCPHCGRKLSPWEQVLLGVDRALMCKGCWYRILLEVFPDTVEKSTPNKKTKD